MRIHRCAVILFRSFLIASFSACMLHAADVKVKTDNNPGSVQLVLPSKIYGVAGVEMNLYFENVALMVNRRNYLINVTCKKGKHQDERWTFIPTAKDVGQFPLLLDIKNEENKVIATATTIIHITDPAHAIIPISRTMLIVGDSLTAASYYPQRLLDLVKTHSFPHLKLIGTTGRGKKPGKTNRHEGRSGWTALRFATLYDEKHPTNRSPFMYKAEGDKPALDFERYCKEQNNGKAPDVVTIFLAPNDIFHATDDTIKAKSDLMLKHYDQLIAMIHKYSPSTKIGVMMPIPPAASQDAFSGYGTTKTMWKYRRHQHGLRTRMLAKYGNRETENISIVPIAVNVDCVHNYPTVTVPANSHSTKKITRLFNAVHPAKSGYFQIGDSLYAWLCAVGT